LVVPQVWDFEAEEDLVSLLVQGDPSGADIGLDPDGEEDANAEGHYANSYPDEDTEPGGIDDEEEEEQWEGQDAWASSSPEDDEELSGFRGLHYEGTGGMRGFESWAGLGGEGGGPVVNYPSGSGDLGRGGGGSSSEEFDVEEYEAEEEWRWQQQLQKGREQEAAEVVGRGVEEGGRGKEEGGIVGAGVDGRRGLLGC
jgi:hypothetical protein